MGNVDAFLKMLLSFDKDNIPEACVDKVEKDYIKQSYFTPEAIKMKSAAAGGLCGWVVNICKYFHIYQVRFPLFTPLGAIQTVAWLGNRGLQALPSLPHPYVRPLPLALLDVVIHPTLRSFLECVFAISPTPITAAFWDVPEDRPPSLCILVLLKINSTLCSESHTASIKCICIFGIPPPFPLLQDG